MEGKIKMIMLYALSIETEAGGQRIERIIINPKDIKEFYKVPNPRYPFVIYAYKDKISYRIELKHNNNFNNIVEFFDYIRNYKEIDFETKEIPTKKEIKVGDIYRNKDKYFLIQKKDSQFAIGIINGVIDLKFNFRRLTLYELTKKWTYIGNRDNDAYNINVALDNFEDFVKDDSSIPF